MALRGSTVDQLATYTRKGTPVSVRIEDGKFSHFDVVDGVTTRKVIPVAAIEDSHNSQSFSPVKSFEKYFTGEVIAPRK
jgi:filamentous hemagglutinin